MRIQRVLSRVFVGFGLVAASAAGASAAVFVLDGAAAKRVSTDLGEAPAGVAASVRTSVRATVRSGPHALRDSPPPPTPSVESPRFDVHAAPAPAPVAASGILALGGLALPDADREVAPTEAVEAEAPRLPSRTRSRSLPEADVRSVVSAGMPALRRCYERSARRAGFGMEITVEVSVRYVGNGAVRSVSVAGADPALASCLETAATSWHFPPSAGGTVTVPVRLRPRW